MTDLANMTTLINRAAGRVWKWTEGEVHNQRFPNLQTFSPVSCLLPIPLSEFTQRIPLGLLQLAPSALILPCHSKLTPPMLPFL